MIDGDTRGLLITHNGDGKGKTAAASSPHCLAHYGFFNDVYIAQEDSVALDEFKPEETTSRIDTAVIRLPRISKNRPVKFADKYQHRDYEYDRLAALVEKSLNMRLVNSIIGLEER